MIPLLRQYLPEFLILRNFVARNQLSMSKKRTTTEKQERKPNWKEYMATVEDIQNFIMDRLMLRHNVITRRPANSFEIRSYGKSELAMLYFPHAQTTEGALSNLRFWIRKCRDLDEALKACGMARQAKSYTPKEVALIVEYLGEP